MWTVTKRLGRRARGTTQCNYSHRALRQSDGANVDAAAAAAAAAAVVAAHLPPFVLRPRLRLL